MRWFYEIYVKKCNEKYINLGSKPIKKYNKRTKKLLQKAALKQ